MAPYLDADRILEETKQGFAFFEDAFGHPYPFGKYDQLFVPEYNAGAMENAGCVTLLEDYIFRSRVTEVAYEQRANTILHEMAHMWFGDLVTMRWWDDLWLNESFAEWASHHAMVKATRYTDAWTELRATSARPGPTARTSCPRPTRSPPTCSTSRPSSSTSTASPTPRAPPRCASSSPGSARRSSSRGCAPTSSTHEWGNTELRDLLVELEATSGRDLSAWTAAVAADRRGQPPAPGRGLRRPPTRTRPWPSSRSRRRCRRGWSRCCAAIASASGSTTSSTAA